MPLFVQEDLKNVGFDSPFVHHAPLRRPYLFQQIDSDYLFMYICFLLYFPPCFIVFLYQKKPPKPNNKKNSEVGYFSVAATL